MSPASAKRGGSFETQKSPKRPRKVSSGEHGSSLAAAGATTAAAVPLLHKAAHAPAAALPAAASMQPQQQQPQQQQPVSSSPFATFAAANRHACMRDKPPPLPYECTAAAAQQAARARGPVYGDSDSAIACGSLNSSATMLAATTPDSSGAASDDAGSDGDNNNNAAAARRGGAGFATCFGNAFPGDPNQQQQQQRQLRAPSWSGDFRDPLSKPARHESADKSNNGAAAEAGRVTLELHLSPAFDDDDCDCDDDGGSSGCSGGDSMDIDAAVDGMRALSARDDCGMGGSAAAAAAPRAWVRVALTSA